MIRAVGHAVDVDGSLLDSNLNPVDTNVYEETFSRSDRVYGFTIRHTLPVGTHYVKLQRASSTTTGTQDTEFQRASGTVAATETQGAYTIQALNATDIPREPHAGSDTEAVPIFGSRRFRAGPSIVV